jgi:hypothetical protein
MYKAFSPAVVFIPKSACSLVAAGKKIIPKRIKSIESINPTQTPILATYFSVNKRIEGNNKVKIKRINNNQIINSLYKQFELFTP